MKSKDWGLLGLTAISLILSYPPLPLGFFTFFALIPFFYFVKEHGFRHVLAGSFLVGLIWAAGTVYWIGWATVAGMIGSIIYIPLYLMGYAVLQKWLWHRWHEYSFLAAPFLWTAVEILSAKGQLGFPWLSLAYTQTYFPLLIQYISITGMYGITLLIVSVNGLLYFVLGRYRRKSIVLFPVIVGVILIVSALFGRIATRERTPSEGTLTAALVQGNIDPYQKWTQDFLDTNFSVYRALSGKAADQKPDLIIWPETATACYLRYSSRFLSLVTNLVDSLNIPLLTGSPDYEWVNSQEARITNSALLIHPGEKTIERYHKLHLVPFSEKVPFSESFPFLYRIAKKMDLDIGNFSPGDSANVLHLRLRGNDKTVKLGVLICYDSVFPEVASDFCRHGAEFLVIITNDGWFGNTSGPYQHAQYAVLRAIETRRWIARCANTGISEIIDPNGKICERSRLNEPAVITDRLQIRTGITLFVRYGHLFQIFIMAASGIALFAGIWFKHAPRKPD